MIKSLRKQYSTRTEIELIIKKSPERGFSSFATDAVVYTSMPPEKASLKAQKDIVAKQIEDNKKLFSFFKI